MFVYCCSHCLRGFSIRSLFGLAALCVSFLVLQSSRWVALFSLCFECHVVLSFFDSFSRCHGLVWSIRLWHFMVILTYFFDIIMGFKGS